MSKRLLGTDGMLRRSWSAFMRWYKKPARRRESDRLRQDLLDGLRYGQRDGGRMRGSDAGAAGPPASGGLPEAAPPRRRFGFLTPWKLPLDETPTAEMSRQELAAWAREQRPLVRALGFRDSALFHPDIINRQYIRTMEYLGRLPKGPYIVQVLLGGGVGLVIGVAMLFMQSTAQGIDYSWHVRFLTGLVMGCAVGVPAGIGYRSVMQFKTVYAPALAMAVDMDGFQWVVRTIREGPLMRLALIDRDDHVFRGSRDESGFSKGRVFLRVPLDAGPVTTPEQWYDWPMLESRARGETPERYHTGKKQARATGGVRFASSEPAKSLKDEIIGNAGITMGALFIVAGLIVFTLATGTNSEAIQQAVGDKVGQFAP